MRPPIVSIVNHKGGCLKTTVTANLGAALSRQDKRVLLIDVDPQQNLTHSLIGTMDDDNDVQDADNDEPTLFDALIDKAPLDDLITQTDEPGIDLVPCAEDFAGADLSLVSAVARETVLKSCLEKTQRLAEYDYVLIDNPPAISLVVVNSLAASDYFLVPCSAEYLPMVGLTLLGESIGKLDEVAPSLRPLGVVITLFSRNERVCRQTENILRRKLGDMVFETKIRVNTKAKSAPSVRKTIFEYERSVKGRGTEDFTQLGHEFLSRIAAFREAERAVAND